MLDWGVRRHQESIMKKYLFGWMSIAMMAFTCVGFASCGDDDDDTRKTIDDNVLIGTWVLNFGEEDYCLLTFSENGKVRYREYDNGKWEEDETYNYTYSNNILRMTYSNGEERETIEVISLSKTTLVLKDWPDGGVNTFVRQ